MSPDLDENACATEIIGAAIEVHQALGPGLLESAYERALTHEFELRGLAFQRQVVLPVKYRGVDLSDCYRLDLIVEGLVIVELKAIDHLAPIHEVQLLTYLRFARLKLGLLLNFHALAMKQGIRRVVNKL